MNAHPTVQSFELNSELGGGTQAVVYRAWDPRLGRPVALKVLRPEWARDPAQHHRFLDEARKAAALEHSNVVKVYGVGEEGGRPYIAYQFIEGETLAQRLRRGRLSMAEALKVLRSVAGALDYAHARGLFHGDIKPSNILVDGRGTVFITDFGLASRADQGGVAGGTPEYMSPELFNGRAQSVASDVYALGATAFELLAGQPPFVGNVPQLAIAHAQQSLPALPGVSRCVEQALQRAMAKRPDQRWSSPSAFVKALECRERPAWLPIAVLVGLLAVAMLVVVVARSTFFAFDAGGEDTPATGVGPVVTDTAVGDNAVHDEVVAPASVVTDTPPSPVEVLQPQIAPARKLPIGAQVNPTTSPTDAAPAPPTDVPASADDEEEQRDENRASTASASTKEPPAQDTPPPESTEPPKTPMDPLPAPWSGGAKQ